MSRNLIAQLVNSARLRMQTQAEFSRELIDDMVDELIDEFMRDGLMTDDANIGVIKFEVKKRLEADLV